MQNKPKKITNNDEKTFIKKVKTDIIDRVSESIVITDIEFKIVYHNKNFKKNFKSALLGNSLFQVLNNQVELKKICDNLEKSGEWSGKFLYSHESKSVSVNLSCEKRTCKKNNFSLYCFYMIDNTMQKNQYEKDKEQLIKEITEKEAKKYTQKLKTAQDQLMQAAKLSSLGTMAAGIAHELNNPLAGIKGFSKILLDMEKDVKKKKFLEKILHSTVRMHSIVNHLRSFTRVNKNEDWKIVCLNKIIADALELLESQLQKKDIVFQRNYTDEYFIYGDHNQVESVIQNLITNSRDAYAGISDSRKKIISIDIERVEDSIKLTFIDNAGGMPENVLKNIYEPFFTTKPSGIGTGLGMSIIKEILENHEASLHIESTPPEGTKFLIHFPYHEKLNEQYGGISNTELQIEWLQKEFKVKPKVLIIDDEPDICELLEIYLEESFEVMTCSDMSIVHSVLDKNTFDLILTDLHLPGIKGTVLIDKIKKTHPQTVVIIISGQVNFHDGQNEEAFAIADGMLAKPFPSQDEVISFISMFLNHLQTEC